MNTTIERPEHEITNLRNALRLAESAAAAALNERDVLARWKKEALVHMRKWDAVDEAIREHPGTLVGHNITDTALRFIRERDEARQQLEALRRAIGVAYAALLEAHDRSKPENQNGASLFHVHQKAKKALAKLQPFLKP